MLGLDVIRGFNGWFVFDLGNSLIFVSRRVLLSIWFSLFWEVENEGIRVGWLNWFF